MRGLLWIAGVLVALWGGWWFTGKTVLQRGATTALAEMAAQGRVAEAQVSVAGFPNRWDLTAEGLRLGDPATGSLWQAPFVQVFAMTWKPWHVIAAFPPEQTVQIPGEVLNVTSEGLMASVRAEAALDLPLAEARVAGTALALASDAGWRLALGEFTVALRQDPARGAAAYELGFDLAPLTPDAAFTAAANAVALPDLPAADLPVAAESLWGTVRLEFTAPLDRHAGETRPRISRVELDPVNAAWGALAIAAKGTLEADANGFAEGRIEIEITNWDRLPAILVAAGAITPQVAPTVANGMRALAAQSPEPSVLALPLVMKEGRMSLGPFPLGPAPVMVPPAG
jgi:hypothetical protein